MKAVCYAIQLPMLPQERFRARNIMTFAQCAVFAGVFFGVPAGERLWGAVWGHTASWACHLVMLLICPHRVNRFHFSAENLRLLVGSFADRHLAGFGQEQLEQFERLLSENDPDIYEWMIGRLPIPPEPGSCRRRRPASGNRRSGR